MLVVLVPLRRLRIVRSTIQRNMRLSAPAFRQIARPKSGRVVHRLRIASDGPHAKREGFTPNCRIRGLGQCYLLGENRVRRRRV
jgi:hypothetical protein